MKKPVNPIVAAVALLVVVGGIVVFMLMGGKQSNMEVTDTGLPTEVAKRMREQGPQPMPPMPGMGGHANAAMVTPTGPPAGKK